MIISNLVGVGSSVGVTDFPKVEESVTESRLVREMSKKEVEVMMNTETYVRQYFSDIPIMVKIAECESHFRHLNRDGSIHRGVVNSDDVGVMQINEFYHLTKSIKENHDIYTLEGNTAYARGLYETKGTSPWKASKACWGKNAELALNK